VNCGHRRFAPFALLLAALIAMPAAIMAQAVHPAAPANEQSAAQSDTHGDVEDQGPGTVTETRSVLTPSGAISPAPDQAASGVQPTFTQIPEPPSEHRREAEKQYLKGAKALDDQDIRGAAKYFSRAVEFDPHNQRYVLAAEIARQHLVKLLVEEAAKARMAGHADIERSKLAEALKLDPQNGIAIQHLNELAIEALDPIGDDRNQPVGEQIAPPIELAPNKVLRSFHVRESAQALLKQVVAAYGIDAVIDESVVPQMRRLDADDVDYARAAEMVELVTGTFIVPLDPKRVLIAGDNKTNRDRLERLAEETVYMPGLTPAEIVDVGNIARNVFDTPFATVLQQRGYMTVRAPVGRIKALNGLLTELLDGQSEIELDVRAFEVATTRTRKIGIQLPQQTTFFNVDSEVSQLIANNQSLVDQIISSGLANAGDTLKIAAILIASGQVSGSILNQPFVLFGGGLTQTGIVPGSVSANLALNASDVRSLDDVRLRVLNNGAASFRTGLRYPIITSTISNTAGSLAGINTAGLSSTLASLGINASALGNLTQNTIPQIQYEDLGLTLKATPRVLLDKEVSLKLDLKIEALGGATIDSIPVLNSRQFTAVITVPDGNSVMLVSNLNRQESKAVSGLPGLSELPGFGSATNKSTEFDQSRLVITITTHIVRQSHTSAVGRMVILPLHE
jgi:general secretion pathway protein D